ncbi:hypothetical protein BVY02_01200 [bacterium J17]|nr:hypothetical protein BVY02_01200 [bacterium J17]
MAVEITMPQLSDTMHEGKILTWFKKEGETVARGDALAEVGTDKADLEIESFHNGTLLKIFADSGETIPVGEVIAIVGEPGEKVPEPSSSVSSPSPEPEKRKEEEKEATPADTTSPPKREAIQEASASAASSGPRIKISPLAKNLALSKGIDYSGIAGSGEGGRIVKKDIEKLLHGADQAPSATPASNQVSNVTPKPVPAARPTATASGSGAAVVQNLSSMRKTIAARMVESVNTIPHFYTTASIKVDKLMELRSTLKPLPQYEGITYNHLFVKALGLALKAIPRINAKYADDQLIQPEAINIGIITAVDDGLLIPVVKSADLLPLSEIVTESRGLVQRARAGKPKPDDLLGATFSISNMGRFSVESFTAIISPGQGAIIAVSPIQEEPVVVAGKIVPGHVMKVTLSVDHRIIDGLVAGEFLTELTKLLEEPVLLLA